MGRSLELPRMEWFRPSQGPVFQARRAREPGYSGMAARAGRDETSGGEALQARLPQTKYPRPLVLTEPGLSQAKDSRSRFMYARPE